MANMKLPICKGTYSNDCYKYYVVFLTEMSQAVNKHMEDHHVFFSGLCYYCNAPTTRDDPLHRCSGCQLVAYCTKNCQKKDWSTHKYVCKEFPVINGNNALYTPGPLKVHIAGLIERAARLPHGEAAAKPLFLNPRVCNTCKETRPERLIDCIMCHCVSYCSRSCSKADKSHKDNCISLNNIVQSYCLRYTQDLTSVSNASVCKKFKPVFKWDDIIPDDYILTLTTLEQSIPDKPLAGRIIKYNLATECLSYPMTLLYALQLLPERHLGCVQDLYQPTLENLTSLEVHVVTSNPLFNSEAWEVFIHRLPKLMKLNVVFVMQGRKLKTSFNLNCL